MLINNNRRQSTIIIHLITAIQNSRYVSTFFSNFFEVETHGRANLFTSVHFIAPIDGDGEVLRSEIKLRPHEEKRGIEGDEHVGEGWRALQDVSKVKLKVSYSLSLCDACICMAIVRPHTGSIIARDKPRFRSLESPIRLC